MWGLDLSIHDTSRAAFGVSPSPALGAGQGGIPPSHEVSRDLRHSTSFIPQRPLSKGDVRLGTIGVMAPGDLGGLNLSTVLRVFFVCGNMRNATDALTMRAAESATALLGIPETIRHILIE
jgi:hypothetical protein